MKIIKLFSGRAVAVVMASAYPPRPNKSPASLARPARPPPLMANNSAADPTFGGVIKEKATESKPWWPPASCHRRARPMYCSS